MLKIKTQKNELVEITAQLIVKSTVYWNNLSQFDD